MVADVVEIVVWVLLVVDVVVVVACVDDLLRAHAHGKWMRAQCAEEHEPAQGHQQQQHQRCICSTWYLTSPHQHILTAYSLIIPETTSHSNLIMRW